MPGRIRHEPPRQRDAFRLVGHVAGTAANYGLIRSIGRVQDSPGYRAGDAVIRQVVLLLELLEAGQRLGTEDSIGVH